jgi:hypothetical protein
MRLQGQDGITAILATAVSQTPDGPEEQTGLRELEQLVELRRKDANRA